RRSSPLRRGTSRTPSVAPRSAPSPAPSSARAQLRGSRRESMPPAAAGGRFAPTVPNVIPRVIIFFLLLRLLEIDEPPECNDDASPDQDEKPGFPGDLTGCPRWSVPPEVGASAARSIQRQLYLAPRAG